MVVTFRLKTSDTNTGIAAAQHALMTSSICAEYTVTTKNIHPVAASRPKLGEILLARNLINSQQLNKALALQSQTTQPIKLGDLLQQQGLISPEEISTALFIQAGGHEIGYDNKPQRANKTLEDILIGLGAKTQHIRIAMARMNASGEPLTSIMADFGFISQETVAQALSLYYGLGYFPFQKADDIDISTLDNIHLTFFDGFVPIGIDEDHRLIIAVPNYETESIARNFFYHQNPVFVFASTQTIQTIYQRHFSNTEQQFDEALNCFIEDCTKSESEQNYTLMQHVFAALWRHICFSGASDAYLFQSSGVGIIKLKIQSIGILFRTMPAHIMDLLINKLVHDHGAAEQIRHRPVEAQLKLLGETIEKNLADISNRYTFRLQLAETDSRRSAVIRILDQQSTEADFDKLGFDIITASQIKRVSQYSHGLFLIVGPTGSGKTTTLYSILKLLDPVEKTIFTIENPIEYHHGLWLQNQVIQGQEEGENMRELLNSALRSAPDVILFGEVRRNVQVANTLIDAANTGHLVFSTLHTNDAPLAITRLKNIGVDLESLAAVLEGVLAQRLVRTLCAACKIPDTRFETQAYLQENFLDRLEKIPHIAAPNGCIHCHYTGYRGRRIVYEFLDASSIRHLIEAGAPPTKLRQGIKTGHSMWDNGLRMVTTGHLSIEELIRCTKMQHR